MTTDELIAKQQLEIEELKITSNNRRQALEAIHLQCVCIGGPLNGNVKGYTRKQMKDFWDINEIAEAAIEG